MSRGDSGLVAASVVSEAGDRHRWCPGGFGIWGGMLGVGWRWVSGFGAWCLVISLIGICRGEQRPADVPGPGTGSSRGSVRGGRDTRYDGVLERIRRFDTGDGFWGSRIGDLNGLLEELAALRLDGAAGSEVLAGAMEAGSLDLVSFLVARGADPMAVDSRGDPMAWRLLALRQPRAWERKWQGSIGGSHRWMDWVPRSGLLIGRSRPGPTQVKVLGVQFLRESNFDFGVTNDVGGSLLHSFIRRATAEDLAWFLDPVNGLGRYMPGPLARESARSWGGFRRSGGELKVLLQELGRAGRGVEWKDRSGETVWFAAWRFGHADLARAIGGLGGRTGLINSAGESVLHHVCDPKYPASEAIDLDIVIEELVGEGMDVNAADGQGRTPLHHAVVHPQANRLVPALMKLGGRLDQPDRDGRTARELLESMARAGGGGPAKKNGTK